MPPDIAQAITISQEFIAPAIGKARKIEKMAKKRAQDIELRKRLAVWFRHYREAAAGMTETEVAELLGMNQGALNDLMNAKKTPSADTIYLLHRAFGADITRMFTLSPEQAGVRRPEIPTRQGSEQA